MDRRITDLFYLLPITSYARVLVLGSLGNAVLKQLRDKTEYLKIVEDGTIQELEDNCFDLICCFEDDVFESQKVMKLYRLLKSGSAVFIIMPLNNQRIIGKRNQLYNLKKSLMRSGFSDLSIYGLSPSLNNIRLSVPLSSKRLAAASLALYQPSLIKAKLRKLLAYFLGLSGFSTFWAPDRVLVARKAGGNKPESLQAFLGKLYGMEVNVALFTGTPGYLRKPTIQIMNTTGSILGYGKIGDKSNTKEIIENEARILSRLKNLDLGHAEVPEVKYLGGIHSDAIFLIQSTCKGHLSSAPLTPQTIHTEFLFRLFDQTKIVTDFEKSTCLKEVSTRLHVLNRQISEDWQMLIEEVLRWSADKIIGIGKIPLGLAHRDFTPWNTFLSKGRLFVFDWEFARERWPPLTDAFHFIIQKGVLVDHGNPRILWDKLFSEHSKEGRFVLNLSSRLGICDGLKLPLLAFYLCDIITLYLDSYLKNGVIGKDELLTCWKEMLKKILSLKENRIV